MNFVPNEINRPQGGILFVGRDPGAEEVAQGRPFVGASGKLLDRLLASIGLDRREVNIANVVGVRPPNDDFQRHDPAEVQRGLESLERLVRDIRPDLIVALGNEASYALVPQWPTKGKGIFGAKDILERRGYFWNTSYGVVLTTLHPAAVLRQPMPGRYLIQQDFRRIKLYTEGRLPISSWPNIAPIEPNRFHSLMQSRLLAWDIETRSNKNELWMIGLCGDDLIPSVATTSFHYVSFAFPLLRKHPNLVGHNAYSFDIPFLQLLGIEVFNAHDTLTMWWALEPELAGVDERSKGRLTRKGLAFLASIYLNIPYWKHLYPKEGDVSWEAERQMMQLNSIDAYVTRVIASRLLEEIEMAGVIEQYDLAMKVSPILAKLQRRGILVDKSLCRKRIIQLKSRIASAVEESKKAAEQYLSTHTVQGLSVAKRCECCGGGKLDRQHCWRCGGLERKPKKKSDYALLGEGTIKELREKLPKCRTCQGGGKVWVVNFNPLSTQQLRKLLCVHLKAPQSTWKGKPTMDDMALRRILRWARSEEKKSWKDNT